MLLFLLQDEIPAIAEQLARDQAQMDKPNSQDIISVLVPKTTKQTSALSKQWYRLLLSSPILGMNRLMENMVVGLNDPTRCFEQGLQHALAALQSFQDASCVQARIQACVERLMGKQKEDWEARLVALAQEHEDLDQQCTQLQRDFAQLQEQSNKDQTRLREEQKKNETLRARLSEASSSNGSNGWKEGHSQRSQIIRNMQTELDKLRDMLIRERRLSAALPDEMLEYGDDF